ncbi:hypothetical protein [Limnobacter sp.]|uniref:type IV pilus modification PilV family protein n=1 Tax=Limnobacter sp. TaxID=2003368 RepID=UPI002585C7E8|nr:hypothetical protein [Limnobacter sp.]
MNRLQTKHLRQSGISIIEAVVAALVLSIGIAGFAKQWNLVMSSNVDSASASRINSLVGNLNMSIQAHASELEGTMSANDYFQNVSGFAKQLANQVNASISAKGLYTCKKGIPVPTENTETNAWSNSSTLLNVIGQANAVCITVNTDPQDFKVQAEDGKFTHYRRWSTQANWLTLTGDTSQAPLTLNLQLIIAYPEPY